MRVNSSAISSITPVKTSALITLISAALMLLAGAAMSTAIEKAVDRVRICRLLRSQVEIVFPASLISGAGYFRLIPSSPQASETIFPNCIQRIVSQFAPLHHLGQERRLFTCHTLPKCLAGAELG